jgi:hypothetical protein
MPGKKQTNPEASTSSTMDFSEEPTMPVTHVLHVTSQRRIFENQNLRQEIFSQLDFKDVANSSRVSKTWRGMEDESVWRALCQPFPLLSAVKTDLASWKACFAQRCSAISAVRKKAIASLRSEDYSLCIELHKKFFPPWARSAPMLYIDEIRNQHFVPWNNLEKKKKARFEALVWPLSLVKEA